MTQEALKFAQTFQNNDETRLERAKQEEIRNQNLMRNNQEQKNEIQYDPKWKRFGGMRPFEVWEKDEPEDPKERDPDVWSPPKVKPNNRGFNRGRLVNYDSKAAAKAQAGKGQNPKGKDTGKNGGKEEKEPKKEKVLFIYIITQKEKALMENLLKWSKEKSWRETPMLNLMISLNWKELKIL